MSIRHFVAPSQPQFRLHCASLLLIKGKIIAEMQFKSNLASLSAYFSPSHLLLKTFINLGAVNYQGMDILLKIMIYWKIYWKFSCKICKISRNNCGLQPSSWYKSFNTCDCLKWILTRNNFHSLWIYAAWSRLFLSREEWIIFKWLKNFIHRLKKCQFFASLSWAIEKNNK